MPLRSDCIFSHYRRVLQTFHGGVLYAFRTLHDVSIWEIKPFVLVGW